MPGGKAKQRFNVYLRPSLIRRAKHAAVDQAQFPLPARRGGAQPDRRSDGPRPASIRGEIVDQEWGRSRFVSVPDRAVPHIDEPDRELYT